MIGDSTDEENDDDNERFSQGVEMLFAPERRALEVDASSTALTKAGPLSTLAANEFYNAEGKALHLNAIVLKRESGWWIIHEEWKWRKAQE